MPHEEAVSRRIRQPSAAVRNGVTREQEASKKDRDAQDMNTVYGKFMPHLHCGNDLIQRRLQPMTVLQRCCLQEQAT